MTRTAELLTAAEAAFVASVSLRDVNRVIDEQILPAAFLPAAAGRVVMAAGCPLISFYFASARRLTADERLLTIGRVGEMLAARTAQPGRLAKEDWTLRDDLLTIDLEPFRIAADERMARLEAARAMVTTSLEVLGGTPVIAGTRVPVHDVAASLKAGLPRERVLTAYPGVTDAQLELAELYAEAYPPRGRPRRAAVPEGAVNVTDRKIARRKAG